MQGVNRNVPKMFQIAPCAMCVFFWKFHENPFNSFSAMLLTDMDSSEKVKRNSCVQGVEWNILKMFPIVPCIKSHLAWEFHKKSVQPFFRNVANRQTDRATDKDENITFAMAEVKMEV